MDIKKIIQNPLSIIESLGIRNLASWIPDDIYLKILFKSKMKYPLDLANPKTFNTKLQWLKLHDRNPLYTKYVDKYEVRKFISEKIGNKYLIDLLGYWNTFDEIDFNKLPNQFVIKCTHDSQSVVICKDKNMLNIENTRKKIVTALSRNFYCGYREWPYKNVPPKIIAEKYMEDKNGAFVDYKFFCFNGYVDCVMVCLDRHLNDTKFYFFDSQWKLKRLNIRGKNAPENFSIPKPDCIDEMFSIASILSREIPFVRVDLFECDGKVFFGELTFFHDAGFDGDLLPETDEYFGKLINLPQINKEKNENSWIPNKS